MKSSVMTIMSESECMIESVNMREGVSEWVSDYGKERKGVSLWASEWVSVIEQVWASENMKECENSGCFSGIRIHELCDAGAMIYQLSYKAARLGARQFVGLIWLRERNNEWECICQCVHTFVGFLVTLLFFPGLDLRRTSACQK